MARMFQVYGVGQALFPVLPPPLPFENPPTSNQTNYEIGQLVYSPPQSPAAFYLYGGGGNWIEIATSAGGVLSVTGTANQILASPTTGAVVLSLIGPYTPATYTAHGVLIGEGTSSIVATAAGTTGQVLTATTSADPAFAAIGTNSGLTAHGVVIAEGTGAFAATAAGSSGQFLVSGGASADPSWQTATPQLTVTPVAGASQAMTSNHSYIANDNALTTFTLPASSAVGDILQIVGSALNTGGWKVTYTTGQIIWGPAGSSTVTTGNAASSAAAAQSVTMVCVVANTNFNLIGDSWALQIKQKSMN
jgi:hypothetical protein